MKITDENWYVKCRDVAHKQELCDYATSKGVPLSTSSSGASYRDDKDTVISWWREARAGARGLMSTPAMYYQPAPATTEAQFKQMCDAYAQDHA